MSNLQEKIAHVLSLYGVDSCDARRLAGIERALLAAYESGVSWGHASDRQDDAMEYALEHLKPLPSELPPLSVPAGKRLPPHVEKTSNGTRYAEIVPPELFSNG